MQESWGLSSNNGKISVYIYNEQLSLVRQICSSQIAVNGLFFCATIINDVVYLGTKKMDFCYCVNC
jgi:hypothetical protein